MAAVGWELKKASVLDEVHRRVDAAGRRVLLAAPYISEPVGKMLAGDGTTATEGRAELDARLLSALTRTSVITGYLSIAALREFLDAGFRVGSIPNLHAKVVVVDDWVLVGSGNLTRSGLELANVELGLAGGPAEADQVAEVFDRWWQHAEQTGGTHNVRSWLDQHASLGRSWEKFANEALRDSKGTPLPPETQPGLPTGAEAVAGSAQASADGAPPPRPQLLDRCVFTIQDSRKTIEEARLQGTFSLSEGGTWTQGAALLTEAKELGVQLALLLGPADGNHGTFGRVTHQAIIDDIQIVTDPGSGRQRTLCTYSSVQPIDPTRALSDLTLNDRSRPMSDADQRPYRICLPPPFI